MRIGIDVGGTKIEGIAIDKNGVKRQKRLRVATPKVEHAAVVPRAATAGPLGTTRRTRTDYHVFMAYSRVDRDAVVAIAKAMEARGIRPWLDISCVRPGLLFQEEIESALTFAGAIAVFIGPKGLGKWEAVETRVAVSLFVDQKRVVIPVILPGAGAVCLPLFLRGFQVVEFRNTGDVEALDNLHWGIVGRHPRRR